MFMILHIYFEKCLLKAIILDFYNGKEHMFRKKYQKQNRWQGMRKIKFHLMKIHDTKKKISTFTLTTNIPIIGKLL